MTKADIVSEIAKNTGLTKADTKAVVEGFLDTIANALSNGERIEIRGFGSFQVKRRTARTARNPRTGEVVPIPVRYVPIFKPSNYLKGLVAKTTD